MPRTKSPLQVKSLSLLKKKIIQCHECPRLIQHCTQIALKKKKEYRDFNYWGKPVPGFGDAKAKLWIVGLAPGAHGANRTGRMFTGDSSGNWLYQALYETGFSNQPDSRSREDGLILNQVFVSSAGRCAPPDNKPTPAELNQCFDYLRAEFDLLKQVNLILALGKIGFDSCLKLLTSKNLKLPTPKPRFGHGALYEIGPYQLLSSYHPSRQNTQTGRLTQAMWNAIFVKAQKQINRAKKSCPW